MAYFAALMSLKHTIRRLLDSSQISFLPESRETLQLEFKEVEYFQVFLLEKEEDITNNINNKRLKILSEQIRKAAYKLEDALEAQVSNQCQSLANEGFELFLDLKEVYGDIRSFSKKIRKICEMMVEELGNSLPEEDDVVSPSVDLGGNNSKMVGLSEEFTKLKNTLINCLPSECNFASVYGMAGIGKTALAMKILEDPSIASHFDPRVFVTIGPKYDFKKVMRSILVQMNHDTDKICTEEDEKIAEHIRRSLQGNRYLIVLDDVWNVKDLEKLKSLLPKEYNRSRVLVTTRSLGVARVARPNGPDHFHSVRFLSKEESWDLLCEKLFGEGYFCPFQLEKFGKKIAENCEGLPLAIITVANILSKEEKTPEFWEKVALKENSVFNRAYDQMSHVLISSYNYLSQLYKPHFLYMGVFPLGCRISFSKLIKLWSAEGLLEPHLSSNLKISGMRCLNLLVSRSLVLPSDYGSGSEAHIKTCYLHSVYWYLCIKVAGKENFLHVLNRYADGFTEGIKCQRRLCIHNNVLFGIKEVRNSMESISTAYSLICTGPYHEYPVPICSGLRLLRVLDTLTIRFYKFPIEVLKLVQLRYLAFTFNGKVPGSISKLWNLETLIVLRHLSINKSCKDSSYLPIEIWDMKELRHIQVTGSNLPDPCGALLSNLLSLSDVSVNSCSNEILEKTPNLKKLGIQIELSPDAVEPLCCFDHLSHLSCLESLKCVVANPKPRSQVVASFTTFPSSLMKLSLSGLGYPWEYMRTIAKLPNLEVLKLRFYAFQGPVWETYEGEFSRLEFLLLEDMDLVHWRANSVYCFPLLIKLIIMSCYKLKEIPSSFGCSSELRRMTLVDCPSFRASAQQLREEYQLREINVKSSLDDEKLK